MSGIYQEIGGVHVYLEPDETRSIVADLVKGAECACERIQELGILQTQLRALPQLFELEANDAVSATEKILEVVEGYHGLMKRIQAGISASEVFSRLAIVNTQSQDALVRVNQSTAAILNRLAAAGNN